MMMESIGSIQNRRWSDSGHSSTRYSEKKKKNSAKEYIIGWEICIVTNTTESRLKYCENNPSEPLKKKCKNDFCYSVRNASTGSRSAALYAGYIPAARPTIKVKNQPPNTHS